MANQLNILPTSLIAGESINKTITGITDVTGFTLSYLFSASTPLTVACTVESDQWTLDVTAAQTLTFKRGTVRFAAMLTETATGVVTCVDSGLISVEASPIATSDYSAALTAVESAIATYGSNPNKRLQLGTMMIEYRDLDDLIKLRDFYRGEIARETGNGYAGGPFRILSRF